MLINNSSERNVNTHLVIPQINPPLPKTNLYTLKIFHKIIKLCFYINFTFPYLSYVTRKYINWCFVCLKIKNFNISNF